MLVLPLTAVAWACSAIGSAMKWARHLTLPGQRSSASAASLHMSVLKTAWLSLTSLLELEEHTRHGCTMLSRRDVR